MEGIKSVILWIGVNSLEDNLDYFTDEAIAGLGPAEGGAVTSTRDEATAELGPVEGRSGQYCRVGAREIGNEGSVGWGRLQRGIRENAGSLMSPGVTCSPDITVLSQQILCPPLSFHSPPSLEDPELATRS